MHRKTRNTSDIIIYSNDFNDETTFGQPSDFICLHNPSLTNITVEEFPSAVNKSVLIFDNDGGLQTSLRKDIDSQNQEMTLSVKVYPLQDTCGL